MTKRELAKKVSARHTGVTLHQAMAIIDTIMDVASDALANGDQVTLRGFGALKPMYHRGRVARDISRQASVWVAPHNVVKFKMSKELIRRCNV
jgi:nucleoid DNA-binding protein